ncbi:EfeM/EfeO family lipoprotein [Cnuibacter physcomitrellae]|uniref:iron uptake system protein EfeO n=1 Tax=Cnuibacter physcomitrellae TaxID=1619308 RepID=UPI00217612F3|nr:iron uptake system protein EfeO [Cnuibacter physcomitrellae]MCS5496578.1 EfeM/EfeO family lipoprotein [Cnuibacter physcomitrellae]
MNLKPLLASAGAGVVLLALAGCVPNNPSSSDAAGAITVDSSADSCTVSADSATSGTLTFSVTNSGDQVTEFYLLGDDGLRIVGEIENVGPGISRDLVVQAQPGDYYTVCKPGMVGDGVGKAAFTVSGDRVELDGDLQAQVDQAATNYVAYVKDQVAQLVTGTDTFLDAYTSGDDATARSLYAITRANYERIEPVAESFGDLDPEIDFREADVAKGDEWTGWHRIEKDLFPPTAAENGGVEYTPLTQDQRTMYADKLRDNTQELYDAVHDPSYTVTIDAISNGAIGLLEEVASGKITGEEEIWSHTDLWDFQANLEGAKVAYEGVRDIALEKDPKLVDEIDQRFQTLQSTLATYGSLDSGFVYYNDLTTEQIKQLADQVNALSEPLSQLTATLVG